MTLMKFNFISMSSSLKCPFYFYLCPYVYVCRCKLPTTSQINSSLSKLNFEDDGRVGQGQEDTTLPPCIPHLRISKHNEYTQQPFIHFVRDSAFAFAYALHNMHLELVGTCQLRSCWGKKDNNLFYSVAESQAFVPP